MTAVPAAREATLRRRTPRCRRLSGSREDYRAIRTPRLGAGRPLREKGTAASALVEASEASASREARTLVALRSATAFSLNVGLVSRPPLVGVGGAPWL